MSISTVSSKNIYDHSNLVNNPPYITNTPLYDYMKERKIRPIDTLKPPSFGVVKPANTKYTDKFITALYISTLGAFSYLKYKAYKIVKNFFCK